ncbi:hypothetical protein ETB97_005372 [Aspergillus alliaceus]|uniref:Cutinase n=1 Tax=Petromyces alliaceus TaxID=209559 RepID=A0A8H5ZXU9_PETAA|nr:hypothetical protein ETB97_005372 [Aspergillus burnettii]
MRNVSNSIAEKILHPDPQAVDYPATWDNPPYSISEGQGVNETRRMLEEYTSTCPNSDIVLLGYSQGAQVVADVLCGTSESGFHPSSPLPWGIGQSGVKFQAAGEDAGSSGVSVCNIHQAVAGGVAEYRALDMRGFDLTK